jgi:hypothetical protein
MCACNCVLFNRPQAVIKNVTYFNNKKACMNNIQLKCEMVSFKQMSTWDVCDMKSIIKTFSHYD